MPIPAYQSILAELIHVRESVSAEPNIRVSIRFFKFLLQLALESRPFDEQLYLDAYPDVREAIARGAFASGKAHFIAHGYFEGRIRGAVQVDEDWYPRAYPDVAPAIEAGVYSSATDHYLRAGVFEWRLPSADAFSEFDLWKMALLDAPPGTPPTVAAPVPPEPGLPSQARAEPPPATADPAAPASAPSEPSAGPSEAPATAPAA